jgi:hypothetical protein
MTSNSLRRSLLFAAGVAAIVGLVGAMPIQNAAAQGSQGYTTDNGGSATINGSGTRGGTDVNGSGPGGPRDPARLNNANPSGNNPNLATGRPGVTDNPNTKTDPYAIDGNDNNKNSRGSTPRSH